MGPGGDFNTARPPRINAVSIVSLNNPAQPLELPIDYYTDSDWQAIPVKSVTSPLAQGVYDDGAFPLRNLSFWPVPSATANTIIYSWTALSQFSILTSNLTFPPGYMEALRYNLALRLIAEMPGEYNPIMVSTTLELATQSLARIRSMNVPLIEAYIDEVLTESSGRYNFYSDMPVGNKY